MKRPWNSNDAIKNYFSDETLKKLAQQKEDLKTKDLNLDLFGYLNLNGEIIYVAKLKECRFLLVTTFRKIT